MPAESSYVVVAGGANMDLKAQTLHEIRPATSNPGTTFFSPGGVGRNIAENLARLGTPVHLVAAVGHDLMGEQLVAQTAAVGVGTEFVTRLDVSTGSYTAVLNVDGELVVAVADMSATDALGVEEIDDAESLIRAAAMLVLDANLAPATLLRAMEHAAENAVQVLIDPVSTPKAERLRPILERSSPLFAITPNRDELATLTGLDARSDAGLAEAVEWLHQHAVRHVWVRLGEAGSLLSTAGERSVLLPAERQEVMDVTGAGDAMLAGFCHALLQGRSALAAAQFGQAAAALTIMVPATVRTDLTAELVDEHVQGIA